MTLPAVTITTQDGNLSVLPASAGQPVCLIGTASSGAYDTPQALANDSAIVSALTSGPLVTAALIARKKTGKPVILIRAGDTTAGDYGTEDTDGVAGTSAITVDAGTEPVDNFEVAIRFLTAGTVGTAGINFQTSLDDGRNWSVVTALGTNTSITIAGAGVTVDLAAGTIVAGDIFRVRTYAPHFNTAELTAALTAARNSSYVQTGTIIQVVGNATAAFLAQVDTAIAEMATIGKFVTADMAFRVPDDGETKAEYQGAFDAEFADASSTHIELHAGSGEMAVNGRQALVTPMHLLSAITSTVSEHVHIADPNLPALPIIIKEAGQPKHYDNLLDGSGLSNSRASVLRTWPAGPSGVYPNYARLFSPLGSDFELRAHRRVFNKALAALTAYFTRRLNVPLRVDGATGYLLEVEAYEIERGAQLVVDSILTLSSPVQASSVTFTLNRTDVVLSTKTLSGELELVPLAYPTGVNLGVGFSNPALTVAA